MGHFDHLIWGNFVLWNSGMWLCSDAVSYPRRTETLATLLQNLWNCSFQPCIERISVY